MPRYYFHTANGNAFQDDDGVELPNNEAARTIGLRYLAELMKDRPEAVGEDHDLAVTITDKVGLILFVVSAHAIAAPAARGAT